MDFLIYRDHPFHGYEYILCVVDVFSRKAATRATTNRKGPTYTRLLKEMIEEEFGGRWPMDLNCDQEFKFGFKKDPKSKGEEENFMQLLADHNVTVHFSETGEVNKNSIMERFIRTLRGMLAKATWALDQPTRRCSFLRSSPTTTRPTTEPSGPNPRLFSTRRSPRGRY